MIINSDNLDIFSTITEKSVREALGVLLYCTKTPVVSELHHLALVNRYLADNGLPSSPYSRTLTLSYLLTEIITDNLTGCRYVWHQISPQHEKTLGDVRTAIQADIQTTNLELIGWSILYHRYVRVDLGLSPRAVSQIAAIDERTTRRYQQHGIRRLTICLFEKEWQDRVK